MQAEWREPSGGSREPQHRAACASPLKLQPVRREPSGGSMQAEWREPSGEPRESQHRAACAAPLSLVGVHLNSEPLD